MKKPGRTRLALYWTRLALYWESSAFVPLLHFVTFRYISLHFLIFTFFCCNSRHSLQAIQPIVEYFRPTDLGVKGSTATTSVSTQPNFILPGLMSYLEHCFTRCFVSSCLNSASVEQTIGCIATVAQPTTLVLPVPVLVMPTRCPRTPCRALLSVSLVSIDFSPRNIWPVKSWVESLMLTERVIMV